MQIRQMSRSKDNMIEITAFNVRNFSNNIAGILKISKVLKNIKNRKY